VKIRNKSKKDTKNINKWVNVLKNKISEYQKDIIFKLKDLFESKLWSEIFKMMKVVKCDKSIDRKTRRIIKKQIIFLEVLLVLLLQFLNKPIYN